MSSRHTQTRIPHAAAYSDAEREVLRHLSPGSGATAEQLGVFLWGRGGRALPAFAILRRLEYLGAATVDDLKFWYLSDQGREIAATL